jgi:hypothetical protein
MNDIYKSDRYFTLYDIVVSHGQLLLRSQKTDELTSNIDIIFFDTTFIQSFSRLKGVKIKRVKNDDVSIINYGTVKKYLSYDNNYLFEIESNDEKYYIAASFVRVFENELEFNETSLGYENKGREKEIAGSR